MNSLTKKLIDFGLTEKEAKVYLATLELEVASVNEIAKQSGINRSSTYVVLESLKKRGLVGISDDKNVRKYVAASPETLLQTAKAAAKKQEEIKSEIESVVPELKALHKDTKRKPKVRVYEGINGVREVYYNIFSTKASDLKTYSNAADIFRTFPDFSEHLKERIRRGIKMYAINPATKDCLELMKRPLPPGCEDELLFIPEKNFTFSSDLAVYDDLIAIASPLERFGVIIESREISAMIRASFDLAWEEAKRLDKEIRKKTR